jgi:hypothetical protein
VQDPQKKHPPGPLTAEHDPEVGRITELQNRERERDRNHRIADRRKRPTKEEQTERPLAKRLERGGQAPH